MEYMLVLSSSCLGSGCTKTLIFMRGRIPVPPHYCGLRYSSVSWAKSLAVIPMPNYLLAGSGNSNLLCVFQMILSWFLRLNLAMGNSLTIDLPIRKISCWPYPDPSSLRIAERDVGTFCSVGLFLLRTRLGQTPARWSRRGTVGYMKPHYPWLLIR